MEQRTKPLTESGTMLKIIAITLIYQLMLLASVPAVYQHIKDRAMNPLRNWRLARTCAVAMLVTGGALYAFLYFHDGELTTGMQYFVLISALYYSVPLASYAEACFNHSVGVPAEQMG